LSDDQLEEEQPKGAPAWLSTFADLMALLMCFFVLLLSFSEVDAQKFKRLAGSMAQAFGVQNQFDASDPPKGTSIIAQEFGPGIPEPTPIAVIYQNTSDVDSSSLDTQCSDEFDIEQGEPEQPDSETGASTDSLSASIQKRLDELIAETEADASAFANELADEINEGKVDVETQGRTIIIRIQEAGSFMSHSADLAPSYVPILARVRALLAKKPGRISIEGHTDTIHVENKKFRSNWELSTARAVSVAHELIAFDEVNPKRFSIVGLGQTKPIADNSTVEGRAINRRVEIMLHQSVDDIALKRDIELLKYESPEEYERIKPRYQFRLREDEIF